MSLFTWLDYSERERRKMLDVVDFFREKETRDELGLASVRDSFADQLFPGTSTIQTRARYFLLVAWTYQALEGKRIGSTPISERARRAETALIEAIEHSDDKEGNIGKYARSALKRLPSSVYWQGLGVWGIRAFQGSLAQYHRSFERHHSRRELHLARKSERDEEHDDLLPPNWHGGLPKPPDGFPEACSLRLSSGDADYLRERIQLGPGCRGSLLAELVSTPLHVPDLDFIWNHPNQKAYSLEHQKLLEHARNFSELMHGAALLYNLILSEECKNDELISEYTGLLEEWSDVMSSRKTPFAKWNREEFWEQVAVGNPRIKEPTKRFIKNWWDLVLENPSTSMISLSAARQLITARESQIKPKNLVRIGNPRAREAWSGKSGSDQMDFRWKSARRILTDIFDGLEADDA